MLLLFVIYCICVYMSMSKSLLSLRDTDALKGIGLLLLLFHHLFYSQYGDYDDIRLSGGLGLVEQIGIWCKLCVAIFVFLSGYGLTVKARKDGGIVSLKGFYWHRLTKLLFNYWFIWICFVPIGVFVFGRPLFDTYSSPKCVYFLLDLFGLINCTGNYGYNVTWWFYSCIIMLYLSFPFLYKLMERSPWAVVAVAVAMCFLPVHELNNIKVYYASFVLGMLLCKYEVVGKMASRSYWWWILFAVLAVERLKAHDVIIYDALLTLVLVLAYKSITIPRVLEQVLCFLGKHSMNIFLFHTFIYHYWFRHWIFISRNPIIIYFTLLGVCIVISVVLQLIKRLIHFDQFTKWVDQLIPQHQ